MVRRTIGTPVAGTRSQYVQYVGPWGASRPEPPVRTQRGRLVRVACTYPAEAPERTCQLSGRQTERAPCASAAARAASNVESSCSLAAPAGRAGLGTSGESFTPFHTALPRGPNHFCMPG